MSGCHRWKLILGGLVMTSLALVPAPARAATVSVYVAYADSLRAAPDFPFPFAVGETFFDGSNSYTVALRAAHGDGAGWDSGAVMILNTSGSPVTINDLLVNDRANGGTYQIWGAYLGGPGYVLNPGEAAIFAETSFGNNFDTSDYGENTHPWIYPGFDVNSNNCSTGPISLLPSCTGNFPIVRFNLNGLGFMDFNDTAHVLDTGGYDSACCVHHHSNGIDSDNESLQWRLIGTTGIDDPGGGAVPEPTSLLLLGTGMVGGYVRRRWQHKS